MFIDRLLNQGNAPLIEQTVRFSAARQRLLAEDVANASTPGYQHKDLSVPKFQQMLQERVDERAKGPPGATVFDEVMPELENPTQGILFHDRSNRSMEQLMADGAKNALYHNMMIELLRKQMGSIELALKERIG